MTASRAPLELICAERTTANASGRARDRLLVLLPNRLAAVGLPILHQLIEITQWAAADDDIGDPIGHALRQAEALGEVRQRHLPESRIRNHHRYDRLFGVGHDLRVQRNIRRVEDEWVLRRVLP